MMAAMKSVFEVAQELAEAHKAEDPETEAIYLAKSPEGVSEVRLVEVTRSLGDAGEVLPFRFAARDDLGVPYASVLILLSVGDWARIESGDLSLPEGWGQSSELQKIN